MSTWAMMVSKSDLLEKRLRSPAASSPVKEIRRPEELSLLNAVNYVHHLSNELWNDAQIFGPHQQQQEQQSPQKNFVCSPEQRKSPTKRTSRSDELFTELDPQTKARLDEIAATFCESLNKNLCTSLLDEVQLWFQLLTENYDSSFSSFAPQDHLFSTVSARSYFVKNVLESQMTSIVMYLDTQVCQLLLRSYPHRIPKHIRKQLEKVVTIQQSNQQKVDQVLSPLGMSNSEAVQNHDRVTFQHETDGRSNFLNQNDFHSFCKQRDLFYAIKDLWTNSIKTPTSNKFANSSFSSPATPASPVSHHNRSVTPRRMTPQPQSQDSGAHGKIRQMIQLNSSPTNLVHLSALVLSQYLLDCSNYCDYGDIVMEDENIRQIFQNNPSKFKQLENRFPNSAGNRSDPLQFFQHFLQSASWPEFNQHLIDRCVLELEEIEASLERQEARTPKEIVESLKKARIVAQLLGFLHFKPYQRQVPQATSKSIRSIEFETLLQRQIRLRGYQKPPIDLTSKLYAALAAKKLIFSLTWIIEYFFQADSVAFHLPGYKTVLEIVAQLYRTVLAVSNITSPLSKSNQAFLRFYCGNLFGRSDFPSHLILTADFPEDFKITEYLQNRRISVSRDSSVGSGCDEEDLVLDSFNLIGEVLNGLFFEKQMNGLKSLLNSNTSPWKKSSGNTTPVSILPVKRNIRPVPVNQISPTKPVRDHIDGDPETTFQLQLEASFFQNHPPSVKRSAEFIAERLASNFVKNLRATIYPQFRDECFRKGIHGEEAVAPFQKKILETFRESCLPKLDQAVDLLVGSTLSEGALLACKQIVARRGLEQVKEWADSHVNIDLFPPGKLAESPAKPQPVAGATGGNETNPAKFKALVKLQQILQKIYKAELKHAELSEFLNFLNTENLGRSSLVVNSTVDVILALFTFNPKLLPTDAEERFIQFWKVTRKSSIKILYPRNVLLFEQSQDPNATWNRVTLLVKRLIKLNMIDLKDVEGMCLGFLRHDWPPQVLKRISEFSKNISGGAPVRTEESEVIDWIAWACSDDSGF